MNKGLKMLRRAFSMSVRPTIRDGQERH